MFGCQGLSQSAVWPNQGPANGSRATLFKPQTDLSQGLPTQTSARATIRGQSGSNRYVTQPQNGSPQSVPIPNPLPSQRFPQTTSEATQTPGRQLQSLPPTNPQNSPPLNPNAAGVPGVSAPGNLSVPSPYSTQLPQTQLPSQPIVPVPQGNGGLIQPSPGYQMQPGGQQVFQPPFSQPSPSDYGATIAPGAVGNVPGSAAIAPGVIPYTDPSVGITAPAPVQFGQARERVTPLNVFLQEARTGRIIVGGSVNSDLGVAGQLVIDERNFNIWRFPRSWNDIWSGRAFRGEGQNFRLELMPGNRVERYTASWTQRNLFGYLPYSLSVGGFYFTRQFRDWTEQRLGGRVAVGYEVTKDLAVSSEIRMEDVKLFDPRLAGIAELDSALGSNDIYTARFRVVKDTRDSPFMATQGALLELIFDQVFGEYDFSRGAVNYSRYFQVRERPDGTGRHVIATTLKLGVTGSQTPIFENYFAGGYSTLRGFSFRGASPVEGDVQVGGELSLLGSVEYVFPMTADDMLRGVAFLDYGTVERDLEINSENFRVSPGLGLRISVPALGPAPLAFDFAYPINHADTDDRQIFSFFMGFTR